MALVIEDGSLVDGATSFATVAQLTTYAASRGVTNLPDTEPGKEVLLIKAMDFLASQESRFQGARVSATQSLSWPRSGVVLFGSEFAEDAIPKNLIDAQCQLAMDAVSVDLQPNGTGREVIREKLDVLETEYAPTGSGTLQPQLNKALSLLSILFTTGSDGFVVPVIRV